MTDQAKVPCPPQADQNDIAAIGQTMARMRLMIGRRFIGKLVVRKVGAGLELSHIDVMAIVRRLSPRQEVTIGVIAEQMHIDPSRGSRVVADLVRRGVLKREASQEDARRSVVALTPAGHRLIAQVDETKLETIGSIVADWPAEDTAAFARLYERFVAGFEQRFQQFEAETETAPDENAPAPR